MRSLAITIVVAGCGASSAPAAPLSNTTSAPTAQPHVVMATIERHACYGWCPIYTLTVYRDGALEYAGEKFVKTKGPAKGRITADQVVALDRLFATAHYLELATAYTEYDVTDAPSTTTSYRAPDGRTKRIEHYAGDRHAPIALATVEDGIDSIAHIDQFIGTAQERETSGRGW